MAEQTTRQLRPETRRIGAVDYAGRGIILEQPMPRPQAGQLLVKVKATLISPGTQLGGAKAARQGQTDPKAEPIPLGYQASGVVAEVSAGVSQFQVGDRIACFGGGALHSDWVVVPQNLCAKIPDGVSFEEAAGMNLVLTAVQAVRRGEVALGDHALIVGMGLVGQLTAQIARLAGASVMGWDMVQGRLDLATRCGIDGVARPDDASLQEHVATLTDGQGFDVAVMAIGGEATQALQQVAGVMTRLPDGHAVGRIVMVGGLKTQCQWGAALGNLDLRCSARTGPGYHDPRWELGQTDYPPVLVRWSTQTNMRTALRWIATGRLKVNELITHRLPLERIGEAVDLLIDQPAEAVGVVLTVEE